ncbi:MAG: RNA-binding protein [Candidatus Marinimicrobia bacterium]|nr:RNA-binding protein [Candidatus Neomarinimicrobiota bacterium]
MNIYVGNLPRSASEDEVRGLFTEHGTVTDVKLIKDQYTSELRGFGFIEMPEKTEALKAIQEVNGKELGGRSLVVNEAKPRESRGGGFRRNGGGSSRGGGQTKRW